MIQVAVPKAPKRHAERAAAARAEIIEAANSGAGLNFRQNVYGYKAMKVALAEAQHRKCCYCEAIFDHVDFGDVDHYRPKAGFKQIRGEQTTSPGYFWLAYDLGNLVLSCTMCNRRHKENLFPLADPANRARLPTDDIGLEQPLLIHPRSADPSALITFKDDLPVAVDGNRPGTETIEILGLDREALNERRREHLRLVESLWTISNHQPALPHRDRAEELLAGYASDRAQFAACTRAWLAAGQELP